MDYTKISRVFIYRERRSLEEFADEQEENVLFIDNMLDSYYFSSADGKERALRCFNTAYYICTLILLSNKHSEWNFGRYCDIAYCGDKGNKVYQSFTLSLVYIFLTHTYYEVQCKKLLKKLEDFFVEYQNALRFGDPFLNDYTYKDVCNDLQKNTPYNLLILEEFKPRVIDKECINDIMSDRDINWVKFTNYWEERSVRDIVKVLGTTEEEKHNVVDMLRQSSHGFYAAGCNDYPEQVDAMLDNIDEEIRLQFNPDVDQAIENDKSVELHQTKRKDTEEDNQKQQLIDALETIAEQNLAIQSYKEQGKGLSAPEAAILITAIGLELHQIPANGREGLAPIIEHCWGKSNSTAAEALRRKVTEQSAEKLAKEFDGLTPKLARLIRELPQKLEEIKNERLLQINPNVN